MTDAATPILHHYAASPFSEKVRLALGFKGLSYGSVDVPIMMPKPDLLPLTGGYRRTPVLQIGADVYCDTQLILREIERRFPEPTLLAPGHEGLAFMISMWADKTFFQTSVPVIFGSIGYNVPEAFKRDREQLMGRPFDTEALRSAAPVMRDQWRAQAGWLEERLAASPSGWLIGDGPGLADIAAYMNLWFMRSAYRPGFDALTASLDHVERWIAKVDAIGHGSPVPMPASQALEIAADAAPAPRRGVDPQEPQGLREGDFVTVAPDDYGRDPVTGTLVFADAFEIAIARESQSLGDIVLHFPRVGFTARRS